MLHSRSPCTEIRSTLPPVGYRLISGGIGRAADLGRFGQGIRRHACAVSSYVCGLGGWRDSRTNPVWGHTSVTEISVCRRRRDCRLADLLFSAGVEWMDARVATLADLVADDGPVRRVDPFDDSPRRHGWTKWLD